MKTATRIVASAISEDEFQALRRLAFQNEKTMSSMIRELLKPELAKSTGQRSSAPSVTKILASKDNG